MCMLKILGRKYTSLRIFNVQNSLAKVHIAYSGLCAFLMYKMTVAVHPVETAIQIAMLAAIHIPINATIASTPTSSLSLARRMNWRGLRRSLTNRPIRVIVHDGRRRGATRSRFSPLLPRAPDPPGAGQRVRGYPHHHSERQD